MLRTAARAGYARRALALNVVCCAPLSCFAVRARVTNGAAPRATRRPTLDDDNAAAVIGDDVAAVVGDARPAPDVAAEAPDTLGALTTEAAVAAMRVLYPDVAPAKPEPTSRWKRRSADSAVAANGSAALTPLQRLLNDALAPASAASPKTGASAKAQPPAATANETLARLEMRAAEATVHDGRVVAVPFRPRDTGDVEAAVEVAARVAVAAHGLQPLGLFAFDLVHDLEAQVRPRGPYVVAAQVTASGGRCKVTGRREVAVRALVRNGWTSASEATAALVFHV